MTDKLDEFIHIGKWVKLAQAGKEANLVLKTQKGKRSGTTECPSGTCTTQSEQQICLEEQAHARADQGRNQQPRGLCSFMLVKH